MTAFAPRPVGRWTYLVAASFALLVSGLVACGDVEPLDFSEIPSGALVVDQDDLKFLPSDLTVSVGEAVYFTNSERAPHTVTVEGDNVSGHMVRGDAFVWTFDTAGEYRVTCDYHPKMRATVTVE